MSYFNNDIRRYEEKLSKAEQALEDAENEYKNWTIHDFDSLEIANAIEDEASLIVFAIQTGTDVNQAILETVKEYWSKDKIQDILDNQNNWVGE